MNTESIQKTLEKLEQTYHSPNGYDAKEVLQELRIEINRESQKRVRGILRSLISKALYPEFKTAGKEDIVYCPLGKGSGKYKLSKYRP